MKDVLFYKGYEGHIEFTRESFVSIFNPQILL